MPKKKSYDVSLVKLAIDRYFVEVCFGNEKKLKMTQISNFLKVNGFSNINDRKLNRDNEIKLYIEGLKEHDGIDKVKNVVTYSPLNVDEFLKTNNNIKNLKIALTIRDDYYSDICNFAIAKYEENNNYQINMNESKHEINNLQNELIDKQDEIKIKMKRIQLLELENKKYNKIIKDTLLPEIANEILREDDIIIDGEEKISKNGYINMILNDSSPLKDEIKLINKRESGFRNPLVLELFNSTNKE